MLKLIVLAVCLFAIATANPISDENDVSIDSINSSPNLESLPLTRANPSTIPEKLTELVTKNIAQRDGEVVPAPAIPIDDALHTFKETLRFGFPTGRIINGHEAPEHSAPYIISIGGKTETHAHFCGGTIIDREWVLTAGHCITSGPIGLSIIAGLHSRNDINDLTQRRFVDFGKIHSEFGGGVGPYDIALLHVSEPFVYTAEIQPAVLPSWDEIHTGEAAIYGWGQPTWYNIFGSTKLQTVTTDILTHEECEAEINEENSPLRKTNICVGSRDEGISSCNGDSGGPLVIEREGRPTEVIGVVSWGYIPCGVNNKPSVFTRVSSYTGWIYNIIGSHSVLREHFL